MGQAKSVPIAGNDFFPTVSLSPDGRIVAVGHTNEIDIFEVTLGSPTTNIKPKFTLANSTETYFLIIIIIIFIITKCITAYLFPSFINKLVSEKSCSLLTGSTFSAQGKNQFRFSITFAVILPPSTILPDK